ncbi:hypothetical protein Ais01nite_43500 [Asanoa ishikariensis]|nr:hypothetical protein Ais01nite_43500 [Asanoa ishikariensis]
MRVEDSDRIDELVRNAMPAARPSEDGEINGLLRRLAVDVIGKQPAGAAGTVVWWRRQLCRPAARRNPVSGAAETQFTRLMTEHGRAVLGYLTRRTEPVQDAADLMAEVFVVAWRRLDAVPAEPLQARAWLLGTARGVLANHRRRAVRRSQLADRLRQYLREQPLDADAPPASGPATEPVIDREPSVRLQHR